MEDLQKQFNLPNYTKNRSFADASSQIKRRFKGREDKESKETEKDLLDRLRQAQEFVKAQEQAKQQATQNAQAMAQGDAVVDDMGQVINRNDPRVQNGSLQPNQPPQPPDVTQDPNAQAQMQQMEQQVPDQGLMGQIQNCMGGSMKKYAEGGVVPEAKVPGAMDIAGASLGAAGTLADLGMKAFGDTGVDTSGATSAEKQNLWGATGGGALKGGTAGAQLGNTILPGGVGAAIGGGIGALAGGTLGLIGGINHNDDAQKAIVANTYMKASKENNQFALGGDPKRSFLDASNVGADLNPIDSKNAGALDYAGINTPIGASQVDDRSLLDKTLGNINTSSVNTSSIEAPIRKNLMNKIVSGYNQASDLPYWAGEADKAKAKYGESYEKAIDPNAKKSEFWKKAGDYAAGSGEALRYAPAAMNAYQLATLKKPKAEGTARIDTRYKPQLTDENALMNAIREETNTARGAIRESSGGSAADTRANLLATQLNSMKGLSSASADAREKNMQERRAEQQFNLGIDQTNLSQANLQQDINDKNIGQYDTQKSKLLASLGDTAGAIGKEELYKKYPEMMGLGYSWRGKYNELTDAEKEEALAARSADKKKKKYTKTGSTTTETE